MRGLVSINKTTGHGYKLFRTITFLTSELFFSFVCILCSFAPPLFAHRQNPLFREVVQSIASSNKVIKVNVVLLML